MKKSIASKKIPHAYLFTGIPGIGKTSMARAMSMALNCLEPVNEDSCGKCTSCRQMLGGNFPDFFVVEREPDKQVIKVEQIKELNRQLGFAPHNNYRVCVVYQAGRREIGTR